jgi:protein-S-isoprenylcysteine O-methyltransferase Ste14
MAAGRARSAPLRVVSVLAGIGAYLAVAVYARGGLHAFFSHAGLAALALLTAVLAVAALFTEGNLSAGEREDRRNRWVIPAIAVIGVLLAIVPPYDDRIGFWTFDGEALRWLGVALYAAGGALRLWPVFTLGRRFSGLVAIQPGHRLETGGPYRFIRHPSYLGLFVNSLGWALAFRSGLGVVLAALLILPGLARIRAEERLLLEQFGDEYRDYCSRTWRLVPGLY